MVDPGKLDAPVARTGGKKVPREATIHIRVSQAALVALDQLAAREERTRSDMIRILLRRGMEHS